MRICIFGAGAVGSHFAVRLALAGHDVSCVMRGPHLEAVKAKDLTLRVDGTGFTAHVKASDDPADLGPQDVVISTLKANSLGSLVTGLAPLLRDHTAVVFAQNGIPWWYDIGLASDAPPPDVGFLDPGGQLRSIVAPERIIGGVVFSSNEVVAPGIVANLSPDRNMLLVGECDDRGSARIERLRADLNAASIQSPPVTNIRETIWTKLLTNMSMSVLCLLTGHTARAVRDDPALQDIIPRLLDEANAVAQSCFPASSASPAPAPRPTTSRRSCRTTNSAAPWKSTRWCAHRRHSRGPPDCRRRCSTSWPRSRSGWRARRGCITGERRERRSHPLLAGLDELG